MTANAVEPHVDYNDLSGHKYWLHNNDERCRYNAGIIWVRNADIDTVQQLNDLFMVFVKHDANDYKRGFISVGSFSKRSSLLLEIITYQLVNDKLIYDCNDHQLCIVFLNGVRAAYLHRRHEEKRALLERTPRHLYTKLRHHFDQPNA